MVRSLNSRRGKSKGAFPIAVSTIRIVFRVPGEHRGADASPSTSQGGVQFLYETLRPRDRVGRIVFLRFLPLVKIV